MPNYIGRLVGKAAVGRARERGWLDVRYGFALFRSRRVPAKRKVTALSIGVALTLILSALELPAEAILAALVPILGVGADLIFEGLEWMVLPVVLASLLLARITVVAERQTQRA